MSNEHHAPSFGLLLDKVGNNLPDVRMFSIQTVPRSVPAFQRVVSGRTILDSQISDVAMSPD